MANPDSIHLWGNGRPQGLYLLIIQSVNSVAITPGKLTNGNPVHLSAGRYVYLGSALGDRGAPLANRTLRHCRRSSGRHHHIYPDLVDSCIRRGWIDKMYQPSEKKPHWHIDHFLEMGAVEVCSVHLFCTPHKLERRFADVLMADARLSAPIPGFGSADDPGKEHFFAVEENWDMKTALTQLREISSKE